MNIVLYLASKYLKFKASDRGLSAVAVIALLTIITSSAAAVVILSAANGIHNNFMQKLMSKDAHVLIMGPGKGIPNYDEYIGNLSRIKGVRAVFPYFERQALLKGNLNVWGSVIMGIPAEQYDSDPEYRKQFILQEGNFDLKSPMSMVLGYNLALNLGVSVGSFVYATVYNESFFSVQYKFKVTGVFSVGHKEYDSTLAFISFKNAQFIFDSEGFTYGIALKVEHPFEVEQYMPDIRNVCPYTAFTWKGLHRNDLAALQDEKMLIMIILAFFFIVVGFNILSTMIAMVLDKKEEIGVLKAMGLKPNDTLRVFLLDGFLLGVFGSLAGILTGLLITVTLDNILHLIEIVVNFVNRMGYQLVFWARPVRPPADFQFFNSSVYYIDKFPMQIQYGDLAFVMVLSVILSTVAVIVPAFQASRLRPVEVLRND
jgi:lipoprotein-releasing system permease protein